MRTFRHLLTTPPFPLLEYNFNKILIVYCEGFRATLSIHRKNGHIRSREMQRYAMASLMRRKKNTAIDIWPGFVDAMATLLMVIIFVLMAFVLAQFYLTDALSDKDQILAKLNQQVEDLNITLVATQKKKAATEQEIDQLRSTLAQLKASLHSLEHERTTLEANKVASETTIHQLNQQIADLTHEIQRLTNALAAEETSKNEQQNKINDLEKQLSAALLSKTEELAQLNQQLLTAQQNTDSLNKQMVSLEEENKKYKGSIGAYRSEFFSKLSKAVGDRADIRIVGDRFVFQSEVLFDLASADLGDEGKKQLNSLAKALKEISANIPKNVQWILRVDGHTDKLPIKTKFPSNWELSSARAISVVKYLISQGISPEHLAATGFGEFQSLEESKDPKTQARNRRIEFKLDQR
jgi:chemotaxis protein MotB